MFRKKWFALFLVLCACSLPGSSAEAVSLSQETAGDLRFLLKEPSPLLAWGWDGLHHGEILTSFYAERDYRPAWVGDLGLGRKGAELLSVLRDAGREGLCPEDYHLGEIEPLATLEADSRRYGVLFDSSYVARLDLLLTDAFLLYAHHLRHGRVDPCALHLGLCALTEGGDVTRLLKQVLDGEGVAGALDSLLPHHESYDRLRQALETLRRLSALGGWPAVPAGPTLRPGDVDRRVDLLRERLEISGDYSGAGDEPGGGGEFNAGLEDALKRFQRRHGLVADGVVGPKTLAELNTPVEARIRQVELNLERWRWLPRDLGRRHLQVNIADFSLEVVEGGRAVMSMPVIVGTGYRKTPIFSARMKYLVFSPYWNVPPTILREDKLPRIKDDPGYLERKNFEIVRGRGEGKEILDLSGISWDQVTADRFPGVLRQRPGPWNPLGQVKFLFPNSFDVYLHDTNDKHLFGHHVRSFSSGCIRVERPQDLAAFVLEEEEDWDCDRILDATEFESPLWVRLSNPLPVHILYRTAWVDAAGAMQFRRDIYQRDVDLELALGNKGKPGEAEQGYVIQDRPALSGD
ncbi:MAG: peptidoglycan-binding protein [Desulfuromonas sp.]|uniref:L,D-transpeptidase family protein n=1 Tax=Desulfuromonas sp. TaxID=892 RepID=UPI000CAF2843|nr:L,D-transpeptidase family protein [Desulfuromonas sp.]PLX85666.1 MAG: peptidoglycan-binding protein [Desulfuromonas sp.]